MQKTLFINLCTSLVRGLRGGKGAAPSAAQRRIFYFLHFAKGGGAPCRCGHRHGAPLPAQHRACGPKGAEAVACIRTAGTRGPCRPTAPQVADCRGRFHQHRHQPRQPHPKAGCCAAHRRAQAAAAPSPLLGWRLPRSDACSARQRAPACGHNAPGGSYAKVDVWRDPCVEIDIRC